MFALKTKPFHKLRAVCVCVCTRACEWERKSENHVLFHYHFEDSSYRIHVFSKIVQCSVFRVQHHTIRVCVLCMPLPPLPFASNWFHLLIESDCERLNSNVYVIQNVNENANDFCCHIKLIPLSVLFPLLEPVSQFSKANMRIQCTRTSPLTHKRTQTNE